MICLSQWSVSVSLRWSWYVSDCTVSVSLRRVICLSQWFIMLCLSDCTVSVSLRRVIRLSQWFIMLCLWLYCISITKKSDTVSIITKKSDMSITVITHHAMFTMIWLYCISITKKSDTSITVIYHAMSLTTVSVSLRRVIRLSQWFIMLCLWLYCTSICDTSITVINHAMSLILYQYH